ncbi:uncharacterized protein LOC135498109 [Lineus longissimus]|uniref:uncharacterized protein LOC135498109 n=1 Tax=Lineus longissimus TaxID=88925 RepID=UPI002B4CABDA
MVNREEDSEKTPLVGIPSEHQRQDGMTETARKHDTGREISPGQITIPETENYKFSFKKLWMFTGPGFLMSIAYLDPGNIESDLQSGAIAKYKLLWVLMWSTVMGLCLQLLAARLGCVTGLNLADVCRLEYNKAPRIVLWLMMEIAIIGSDIQEVIGSAIAINLLSNGHVPIWAGVIITGADTFTFLLLENAGLRKLEALFGVLITTMAFSFMYMYITVKPDQGSILIGLWFPWCQDCDSAAIQQMVGIVGAVIMPHNIYLHSALVLSRDIDRTNKKKITEANMYYSIESAIALFVSFMINLFVVSVFAKAFSNKEEAASLAIAGEWINDSYGLAAKIIWGIGILAAGQSSTMTGTYAGQFVMQGFLKIQWAKWKRVLLTRSIAMVPTIIVALIATNDLDAMNTWLNILQSVQLPFALLPILHFTNSQRIMGEFKNGRVTKSAVWVLALLVMGINLYLVYISLAANKEWWIFLIAGVVLFVYLLFVLYLAIGIRKWLELKIWFFVKVNASTTNAIIEYEEYESRIISCLGQEGLEEHPRTSNTSNVEESGTVQDGYAAINGPA